MGIISLKTPIIICVFNPTNINMKIQGWGKEWGMEEGEGGGREGGGGSTFISYNHLSVTIIAHICWVEKEYTSRLQQTSVNN